MKHTFPAICMMALIACGGDSTGQQAAPASTEAPAQEKAAADKHWVDKSTVDALPADARKSVLGAAETPPAEGADYVALANELASANAQERITAARAISLTMATAKGDYKQALELNVKHYVGKHTREFLGLFNGTQNMGKRELMAWANVVRGGEGDARPDPAVGALMREMKTTCRECDAAETEVLDYFLGLVTGSGGKKGELK